MRKLVGDNDVLAYLVMMAARLVELRRVLKPTGSLYLHCDPTASHYLKIILDALFGPDRFANEVIWKRTAVKGDARVRFGRNHDVLLYYGKNEPLTFNRTTTPHTPEYRARFRFDDNDGRGPYRDGPLDSPNPRPNLTYPYKGYPPPKNGWRVSIEEMERLDAENRLIFPKAQTARIARKLYLEDQPGVPLGDVWSDIAPLNSQAAERLGYPTQKPLALLERIIRASSNEGDLVLDPFCGCGTAVDAAQRLNRRWIGIDITFLAIDLIENRLRGTYGDELKESYTVSGIPQDAGGATALFNANPFDFERWAVSLVDGQPNEKQVGDKGIDGVIRIPLDNKDAVGEVLVSVKGGKQLNPAMVRDLAGTVQGRKAEMGVLICMGIPTPGMLEAAKAAGNYRWELTGTSYPRVQIMTVSQLLAGQKLNMPTHFVPYLQAKRLVDDNQLSFGL
jgi:DNA modification methylase